MSYKTITITENKKSTNEITNVSDLLGKLLNAHNLRIEKPTKNGWNRDVRIPVVYMLRWIEDFAGSGQIFKNGRTI